MNENRKNRKRLLIAGAAAFVAFGGVIASAAGLGGLTGTTLGAETSVVAGCDTNGVNVAYTTAYDAALPGYRVSSVNLSGIDAACNGKTLSVTLSDATNASLGSGTQAVAGTTANVAVSASAAAVTRVSVVISG